MAAKNLLPMASSGRGFKAEFAWSYKTARKLMAVESGLDPKRNLVPIWPSPP
jgi:hypothetical protein